MNITPVSYTENNFQACVARSFKEIGFAVLIDHPLDTALIDEVHREWKDFFAHDDKTLYRYNKKTLDGYFPFGEEKESQNHYRDLKEFYYFYVWGKCPLPLREKTLLLYNQLNKLGSYILKCLESYLPEEIRNQFSMPLTQMVRNSPRAVLRILHYPPVYNNSTFSERIEKGALRAVEHEDLTLISIIMPLIGEGLELKDSSGNWHGMPAGANKLALNIGDMLELCTKGFYKATTHRVVNPEGEEGKYSRYSNAFFLNPRDEVILDENHTALDCLKMHVRKKLEYEQLDLSNIPQQATEYFPV